MYIIPTLLAVVAALFMAGSTSSTTDRSGGGVFLVAHAECMDAETSGASITEGAWNVMGVNGTMDPPVLDENNINTQDSTWTIPDGMWSYPHGEMGDYGPRYMTQYTCSTLQFCNPKGGSGGGGGDVDTNDSTAGGRRSRGRSRGRTLHSNSRQLVDEFSEQEVMHMASKQAFEECDYTDAVSMGTTNATHACVLVSPKDDLTAEGTMDYYASAVPEHCVAGQKIAVTVGDHDAQARSCGAIAMHIPASDRLRNCDCTFDKKPFSARYPSLCAYGYQEECFALMADAGEDCCESETCFSNMEVFATDEGKEYELNRRTECNDDIPGNCYNMDGVANDLSEDGSTDCCSQTCRTCGSELASGAVWETCTSNTPSDMTATCGRLSRYAPTEHICDFTQCPVDSVWGTSNPAIYAYMGVDNPNNAVAETTTTDTATTDTNGSVDESAAAAMTTTTTTTLSIIQVLVVLPTTVLVIGTAFL